MNNKNAPEISRRNKFLFYAVISFLCLIVGAALPIPNLYRHIPKQDRDVHNAWINAASQVLVGTSASVLAASLIEIFSAMSIIRIKERKKNVLKFFFGSSLNEGEVAIIIPKFDSKSLAKNPPQTPPTLQQVLLESDSAFLSFSDTTAAINIEILLQNQDFNRPKMIFGDTPYSDIIKYKTVFMIGLFTNEILINSFNQSNLFVLTNTDEKKEYSNDNDNKYGLIAKLKTDNTNIFVIGGIDAEMTIKCSQYFLDKWEDISNLTDDSDPNIKVEDRQFAICMKSSQQRSFEVFYKFIQNE